MGSECFSFRQFTVRQDRCAMKVGTDGTILGAWARMTATKARPRILDIGTGTGLVALMMAQRYPQAWVSAIDIDPAAAAQAEENVRRSPFARRITVERAGLQAFEPQTEYDAIVCNPPFFTDSLTCPDGQRTLARHTASLSYEDLMKGAARLLAPGGRMSVIVPADCVTTVTDEGIFAGLMTVCICRVHTLPGRPAKRALIELTNRQPDAPVRQEELTMGSEEYRRLTADFYLNTSTDQ